MKTNFFLFAIPCFFITACTNTTDKDTGKQKADSLAAVSQRDSLLNAAKMMHKQDSIDATKADTSKGQK